MAKPRRLGRGLHRLMEVRRCTAGGFAVAGAIVILDGNLSIAADFRWRAVVGLSRILPLALRAVGDHDGSRERLSRKSYVARREPDGTFAIHVSEDLLPIDVIRGFPTLDSVLDECARLNDLENGRRRREEASNA
jgi:hypothetical protein